MPFSSGTFSLIAGNPVITGTVISSTWANSTLTDIASGLSTCLLKDGTQTPAANIPMGGFRLTGLGAGSAVDDAPQVRQVQNSSFQKIASVAGGVTITGSVSPTPTALVDGQLFNFVPAATNTAAATLNVNSLGAKAVTLNGQALVGGELVLSAAALVRYHSANSAFEIIGPVNVASGNLYGNAGAGTKGVRVVGMKMASGQLVGNNWQDPTDPTKQVILNMSGLASATTITLEPPTANGKLMITADLPLVPDVILYTATTTAAATAIAIPFPTATTAYEEVQLMLDGVYADTTGFNPFVRLNGQTAAKCNYVSKGSYTDSAGTYNDVNSGGHLASAFPLGPDSMLIGTAQNYGASIGITLVGSQDGNRYTVVRTDNVGGWGTNAAREVVMEALAGMWTNTAVVTAVNIVCAGASFQPGAKIRVYGRKG